MKSNLTIKGNLGIGHTRWATMVFPTPSMHPPIFAQVLLPSHVALSKITYLSKTLKKDIMRSQTDSEVIAHLIGMHYKGL